MKAVARAVLLGAMVLSAAGLGCGPGEHKAESSAKRETAPQWQDVFDGTPEIYAVIRPQAIKRDAVYGSLFKSVMQMAQARSEMRGVTSLEDHAAGASGEALEIEERGAHRGMRRDRARALRHLRRADGLGDVLERPYVQELHPDPEAGIALEAEGVPGNERLREPGERRLVGPRDVGALRGERHGPVHRAGIHEHVRERIGEAPRDGALASAGGTVDRDDGSGTHDTVLSGLWPAVRQYRCERRARGACR